ncbi:DoxX family protein [Erythrobacter sp. YT30]|uniref:DoxX family protein n=1 Tax=Erythrobacter sp. YT30 TaxID=1735012 RepID=UPI0009EB319A|nr:DoxX family protein [Erythrobacter sp. YT30]
MNTLAQDAGSSIETSKFTSQDMLALGGRLLLAAIFILSGVNKLGAVEGTIGYIASAGLPFATATFYAVVALEIVGGVMLVVGVKPRLTAVALAVFSIVAAIVFHSDFADQNQMIHFLKNLALAGGLLQVAAFGAGRLSIDRK